MSQLSPQINSMLSPSALGCPTCRQHFRATPSSAGPVVLGCGHSVCYECAGAMAACDPAVCLVCREPIVTSSPNTALGEFAEQAWLALHPEVAPVQVPAAVSSLGEVAHCQTEEATVAMLLPLLDSYEHASVRLTQAAEAVASARHAVLVNTLQCAQRFNTEVDGLVVAVEAYSERWLAAAQTLADGRTQLLEARSAELVATAAHLAACIERGRSPPENAEDAAEAEAELQAALVASERVAARMRKRVETRMDIVTDMPSVMARLEEGTRLKRFEVDGTKSTASGLGLSEFGAAGNAVLLTCKDQDGDAADWVTVDDLEVSVTGPLKAGGLTSAVVVAPGVIELQYAVDAQQVDAVRLSVIVCGVLVAGSPWTVRSDAEVVD